MSPAWIPPRSGCAIRSTVAGPKRRRKNAPTDSSSPSDRIGRSGSIATRSGRRRQQVVMQDAVPGERKAEKRRLRKRIECVPLQHEGPSGRTDRLELRRKAQRFAQFQRRWLLGQHRIRARFDGESVRVLGANEYLQDDRIARAQFTTQPNARARRPQSDP